MLIDHTWAARNKCNVTYGVPSLFLSLRVLDKDVQRTMDNVSILRSKCLPWRKRNR